MTNASVDSRYLEVFSQWLRSLGEDTTAVGAVIASSAPDDAATRWLVAGLNYIFKSLDLIPDGVDDLGYLDDAFVLRVASALAVAAQPEVKTGVVERLADDARAVRDFLEGDFGPPRGVREGSCEGSCPRTHRRRDRRRRPPRGLLARRRRVGQKLSAAGVWP